MQAKFVKYDNVNFLIFLKQFPNENWNWENLSKTAPLSFIRKNTHLSWIWSILSKRISWEILKDNLDKPLSWRELSCNRKMTIQIITENSHLPWE